MTKKIFYNKDGYMASLEYLDDDVSPRERGKKNMATIMAWHPRLSLGDSGCPAKLRACGLDELPAYFFDKGFVFLPLFLEDPESDIPSLSLNSPKYTSSMHIGFVYISPDKLAERQYIMKYSDKEKTAWAIETIKEEVAQFQAWLSRAPRPLLTVEDIQSGDVIFSEEISSGLDAQEIFSLVEEILRNKRLKAGLH